MAVLNRAGLARLKRWLAESLVKAKFGYHKSLYVMEELLHVPQRVKSLTPRKALGLWKESAGIPEVAGHPMLLYMHFPYCRFRCVFCHTSLEPVGRKADVRRYVDDSSRELDYLATALDGRKCALWRVGGGTPSLLDAPELRRWLEPAARRFSFTPDSVRTIEFHPASTDEKKLALVRSLGFDRVSFGVQSMSAKVLGAVGRGYQETAMVSRSLGWARRLGFAVINADLIVGLIGESAAGFLEGFRAVAESRPTSITVYCLDWSAAYARATGLLADEYERYREKLLPEVLEKLPRVAARMGYRAESFWPQRLWCFVASESGTPREEHDDDGSTLGLGWNSSSHIFGRLIYVRRQVPFAPDAPIYNVSAISLKEEMGRWVSFHLQWESRVEYAKFHRCFGADIREAFALELGALRSLRKIRENAAGFDFLPTGSAERVFYACFFFLESVAKFSPPPKSLRDLLSVSE